jgi:hypothetical protein
MRCIKSSTKAHLNDRRGDLFLAEGLKDGADEDLKLGRWPNALFNLVSSIKGARHRLGEWERGEGVPIDLHPLAVADQVRLRGGGVADPRRAKRCGDEGDDAPLAICAGDQSAANPRFGRAESAQEGL